MVAALEVDRGRGA